MGNDSVRHVLPMISKMALTDFSSSTVLATRRLGLSQIPVPGLPEGVRPMGPLQSVGILSGLSPVAESAGDGIQIMGPPRGILALSLPQNNGGV